MFGRYDFGPALQQREEEEHTVNPAMQQAAEWLQQRSQGHNQDELPQEQQRPLQSNGSQIPRAEDGQSLADQSPSTRSMFRDTHGWEADARWIDEHNRELAENRRRLGTSEPSPTQTPTLPPYTGPHRPNLTPGKPSQQSVAAPVQSPSASTAPPSVGPYQYPTQATPADPSKPIQTVAGSPEDTIIIENQHTGERKHVKRFQHGSRLQGHQFPLEDGWVVYADSRTASVTPANALGLGNVDASVAPTTAVWPGNANTRVVVPTTQASGNGVPEYRPGGTGTPASTTPGRPAWTPPPGMLSMPQDGKDWVAVTTPRDPNPTWVTRENFNINPGAYILQHDPKAPVAARPTSSVPAAIPGATEPKPITRLAEMAVRSRGGSMEDIQVEQKRILNGIGSLVRGDPEGAEFEGYLNDVARFAWAKQEAAAGRQVDVRQAPREYIESWKDAFWGSDTSVPMVRELDQQLIDAAVTRTPSGKRGPFDWRKVYGPTGEGGLISRQVASNDCGPNAFSTFLRSRGYNADPGETFKFAKKYGYHNGNEFTGAWNFARMLREEAGLDAQAQSVDWDRASKELDAGRPVAFSGPGHYWVATAYRDTPRGREYYVGATGAAVGNPQWALPNELRYEGTVSYMITASGDVRGDARAVTEMGLRPPGPVEPTRNDLTRTANPVSRIPTNSNNAQGRPAVADETELATGLQGSRVTQHTRLISQVGRTNGVDPYFIAAVMDTESEGKVDAVSRAGARGLMQLMPDTARGLGVKNIDDPLENADAGSRYLRQMLDRYDGDLDLALAAYHAGPGYVDGLAGDKSRMYGETKEYVATVRSKYRGYRAQGGRR